jgi:hypothetical protein
MTEVEPLQALAVLILTLTAFIVVFVFASSNAAEVTTAFSAEQCRATMALASRTNSDIFSIESPLPLQCSTKFITVKWGNPKQSKGIGTNNPVYYVETPDELKKIFAQQLSECWWEMGEGKLKPFIGNSNSRCVICSDINVDPEVSGHIPVLSGFNTYLKTEKNPRTKQPYGEFFAGAGFPDIFLMDRDRNTVPYSVVFWYLRESTSSEAAKKFFKGVVTGTELGIVSAPATGGWGIAFGAAGGFGYGTTAAIITLVKGTDASQWIILVPYNNIGAMCQQLF